MNTCSEAFKLQTAQGQSGKQDQSEKQSGSEYLTLAPALLLFLSLTPSPVFGSIARPHSVSRSLIRSQSCKRVFRIQSCNIGN